MLQDIETLDKPAMFVWKSIFVRSLTRISRSWYGVSSRMCSRSTTRVGFYITCVDEPQEQNMEFVPLSDVALRHLALDDPILKRVFHGVHPSDGLPSRPTRTTRTAYIVNTDPRGEPGKHWLGLWTEEGACEVMDSYGLPLTTYQAPGLHDWLARWSPVWHNDRTLQALNSTLCFAVFKRTSPRTDHGSVFSRIFLVRFGGE